MKQLKTMCLAIVLGLGMTGAAQAADPLQQCTKAVGKLFGGVFKEVGKAAQQICSGKTLAEVAPKATARINKAVDKINKVHAKVDCNANGDPDTAGQFPQPAITQAAVEGTLASVVTACDGV